MNIHYAAPRASTPDGFQVYCAYDEIIKLDQLRPNPQNPNKHPQEQVRLLANILRWQGWRAPITVSRRSGFIVRGHARRLAGYEAGGEYAPVEYQDYESDAAETTDLIADNRIAELAVLDEDAIAALIKEFEYAAGDIDPELTGFTAEQIRELIDAGKEEEKEGGMRQWQRKENRPKRTRRNYGSGSREKARRSMPNSAPTAICGIPRSPTAESGPT